MRYLLDVNALIALGHTAHEFHPRMADWAKDLSIHSVPEFATTPITELGFVRIVSHVYSITIEDSKLVLQELKDETNYNFRFIEDGQDASLLPSWVIYSKQTTDGHLVELAYANGCVLATMDEGIPGAFIIPK